MQIDPADAAGRMADLLEGECELLRQGAFDKLAGLAEEKAALIGILRRNPPAADVRRQLARLASESGRHLSAAQRGIRAARHRLDEAVRAVGATGAYDPDGQSVQVGVGTRAVERRA